MANGKANCRLLAIGLDAAEPSLVRRWAAAGLLPALARLIAAGATRPLRLEPGLYAGSVWPSLFTGRSAGAHGRYNYLKLQPGGYAERRFDPAMLGAEPFWMRLSRAGLHTTLLDIPKMPLPDRFQGTLVSDWGTHDPERPMTALPAEVAGEVHSIAGIDPVGNCDRFRCRSPAHEALADALCDRANRRTALALHLLEKAPSDLAFLVYSEPHCGGHHLWAAHARAEAAGRGDDPAADPYLRMLQAIDRGIGRLLAAVGPRTPVLVVLSHGMGAHNDASHLLDRALRRLDGTRARRRPLRLAAGALFRLHCRLPRRLGDPTRSALMRFIDSALVRDRECRRWFQLATNDNAPGIRLNLVGREPHGLIAPGAEFEATLGMLRARLLELENPATGARALRDVIETRQAFRGERSGELPDLVLLWNRDHPFDGLRAPWLGTLRGSYRGRRVGDHRGEGLLIAAAPGLLDDGARPALSAMALAPTITAALGLPSDGYDDAPFMPFVEAARRSEPDRRDAAALADVV